MKNKSEIISKIRDMPVFAKTVKDRTIKMAANIASQQIMDINLATAYSIACDESKDVSDIEQIDLLCRYVNSAGPQEVITEIIRLKGQTREEDICEAVLDCLKTKEINTSHLVSAATDGAPSMTGAQQGFVTTSEVAGCYIKRHCVLKHFLWSVQKL